jgi:hypothetical protein
VRNLVARVPFLVAVALVAAALGDAIVETLANGGLVGPGFADDNHSSVIPALVAGALLALEVVRRRCTEMLRRGNGRRQTDWVLEFARRYRIGSPLRDLASILGLQLVALFAMESAEQLAFGGKLLGGTAWLGGPMLFSLVVHALVGAGCTFSIAWFVRTVPATVARLVQSAVDSILMELARAAAAPSMRVAEATPHRRTQAPHVRQIGDRAPPLRSFALS